jgi:hypothetical protein
MKNIFNLPEKELRLAVSLLKFLRAWGEPAYYGHVLARFIDAYSNSLIELNEALSRVIPAVVLDGYCDIAIENGYPVLSLAIYTRSISVTKDLSILLGSANARALNRELYKCLEIFKLDGRVSYSITPEMQGMEYHLTDLPEGEELDEYRIGNINKVLKRKHTFTMTYKDDYRGRHYTAIKRDADPEEGYANHTGDKIIRHSIQGEFIPCEFNKIYN